MGALYCPLAFYLFTQQTLSVAYHLSGADVGPSSEQNRWLTILNFMGLKFKETVYKEIHK